MYGRFKFKVLQDLGRIDFVCLVSLKIALSITVLF